jgi:Tol biopolymer transport system component
VNDWSPDGQEIVYHSMRDGGQRDVLVVSAGMKTEAVANSSAEEQHSAWGPDGNSIIFDRLSPPNSMNQV